MFYYPCGSNNNISNGLLIICTTITKYIYIGNNIWVCMLFIIVWIYFYHMLWLIFARLGNKMNMLFINDIIICEFVKVTWISNWIHHKIRCLRYYKIKWNVWIVANTCLIMFERNNEYWTARKHMFYMFNEMEINSIDETVR